MNIQLDIPYVIHDVTTHLNSLIYFVECTEVKGKKLFTFPKRMDNTVNILKKEKKDKKHAEDSVEALGTTFEKPDAVKSYPPDAKDHDLIVKEEGLYDTDTDRETKVTHDILAQPSGIKLEVDELLQIGNLQF